MADGMLALSWNNHSTTFCHMLSQIRLKDRYTDATVACEGKFYPVHRIVLSTCSKYFEEMFELTSAGKHPIVLLQDVRKYELEALLSYMYAGVVSVAQKDLSRLIKIAELLQIKGLAVPDELPSEKKSANNQSERTSSGSVHHKSSHSIDPSDGRTSPYRKRRRREERGMSPPVQPSPSSASSSKPLYNQDDDDIQEIRDVIDKEQEERLGLGPMEDSSHNTSGGEGIRPRVPSDETTEHHQTSPETPRKSLKDGSDEMVWVKEEVLDDPGESQGESIKTELPMYGSLSATGDDSMDMPPDDQDDYSQTSHGQIPPPLSEPGAEALAGPSGIHEWLSGGDMTAGLPAVDNYVGEGSPPTSDHPQSQQMEETVSGRQDLGMMNARGYHTDAYTRIHTCLICHYSTPRRYDITKHIRRHTGEKPFACPYCAARFTEKSNLNQHLMTHVKEKPFACSLCPFTAVRKLRLDKHMQSHLKEQQSLMCPVCARYFPSNAERDTHMQTHNIERV